MPPAMTETDDIVARLRGLCSPAAEAMSDSERLTQLVVVGGRAATALAEHDGRED